MGSRVKSLLTTSFLFSSLANYDHNVYPAVNLHLFALTPMDFVAEHFDRHEQLTNIHEHFPSLYAQLLSKFEIQKKELIEYKTKAHYWETQFNKLCKA